MYTVYKKVCVGRQHQKYMFENVIFHFTVSDNRFMPPTSAATTVCLSPTTTTLEDVLDSLLGLTSTGRTLSPGLQGRRHV